MLSTTSEYALRALIELARDAGKSNMVPGKELSERAQIPANYLSKILIILRNGGLLDTVRGTTGGYHLSKAPDAILLIDVVELIEGARSRPSCILWHCRRCSDDNPCAAHHRFRRTRKAYLQFLETTTIAMLAKSATAS